MAERKSTLGWAFFWTSTGTGAVVALFAAPGLPIWSLRCLLGLAAVSFTLAAYFFGWFRAPTPIGKPVKVLLVVGVIWSTAFYAWFRLLPTCDFSLRFEQEEFRESNNPTIPFGNRVTA